MNEELILAIDELRRKPAERIWFIPVLLNPVELPEREIGGGETLSSLHQVLLYEDWDAGVETLLRVLAPQKTSLDLIRASLQIVANDLLIENSPLLPVLPSEATNHDLGTLWAHSVWSLAILVRNNSNEVLPLAPNGLSLTLPSSLQFGMTTSLDILHRRIRSNTNWNLRRRSSRELSEHVLCDSSPTEVNLPSMYA